MEISKQWLKDHKACYSGYEWSLNVLKDKPMSVNYFINELVKAEHYNWANWVFVRVFDKQDKVRYAVFAAEQVISIFEKKYPNDKRPRKAIEAAKAFIENPCEVTRKAAAYAAAYAAAAYTAADAAAYAAAAAADADADAAAYAAAAYAADAAADAARKEMQLRIINYGVTLLTK